jgi:hypothetical protein
MRVFSLCGQWMSPGSTSRSSFARGSANRDVIGVNRTLHSKGTIYLFNDDLVDLHDADLLLLPLLDTPLTPTQE